VGESHRLEHLTDVSRLKLGVPAGWTLQRASHAGDASLDEAIEGCYVEMPIGVNIGPAGPHDINDPDYLQQILAVFDAANLREHCWLQCEFECTPSIFRMILSAHCTAAATIDSVFDPRLSNMSSVVFK
jgi:hypothetical protein